jgi:hypothetical protein
MEKRRWNDAMPKEKSLYHGPSFPCYWHMLRGFRSDFRLG